jgi:hypothetical protein
MLAANVPNSSSRTYKLHILTILFTSSIHTTTLTGAGSAGLGVCAQILDGLRNEGLTEEQARSRFVVFSHKGVLGEWLCI